jgi:hypothetical protein
MHFSASDVMTHLQFYCFATVSEQAGWAVSTQARLISNGVCKACMPDGLTATAFEKCKSPAKLVYSVSCARRRKRRSRGAGQRAEFFLELLMCGGRPKIDPFMKRGCGGANFLNCLWRGFPRRVDLIFSSDSL